MAMLLFIWSLWRASAWVWHGELWPHKEAFPAGVSNPEEFAVRENNFTFGLKYL